MSLIKNLTYSPIFWIGFVLRLTLLAFIVPAAASEWYIPFFEATVGISLFDPWGTWAAAGGSTSAFPYGYVMWIVFLPAFLIKLFIPIDGGVSFFSTILVWEFIFLGLVATLAQNKFKQVLTSFWLSPVMLIPAYAYGYNDIVPAVLLLVAVTGVRRGYGKLVGISLAMAVSAKLSMLVAVPLFALYFLNKASVRHHLRGSSIYFIGALLILNIPFLMSPDAIKFVFTNPELMSLGALTLDVGGGALMLAPLAYTLFLYWIWRARRLSFNMLISFLGIVFLALALLTPQAPGWFVWSLPFLIIYQVQSGAIAARLGHAYAILFALGVLANHPIEIRGGGSLDLLSFMSWPLLPIDLIKNGLITMLVTLGFIIGLRMWRESISENAFFRVSRRPFMVAIAGDSGSGKDTYASALIDVFGKHSAMNLSGDDYHKYDRQKPMWQVMTHLNPAANNLEAFSQDVSTLRRGESIFKRHYSHLSGKLSRPERIASKDFVIASGLHAFVSAKQDNLFDLRVFLAMDESLRRYYKIRRDTLERQKTLGETVAAIESRRKDYSRFVAPQQERADIVFSLIPEKEIETGAKLETVKLMLRARFASGNHEEALCRVLTGILGCEVIDKSTLSNQMIDLTISGNLSSDDINFAVEEVCRGMEEVFDIVPVWHDGMTGLMQVITLMVVGNTIASRGSNENII